MAILVVQFDGKMSPNKENVASNIIGSIASANERG
jgi:hypothetical protein